MNITRFEDQLLLGLNTTEALLLLRLLQTGRLRWPSNGEPQKGGDADRMLKDLTAALLNPSEPPMASVRPHGHEAA